MLKSVLLKAVGHMPTIGSAGVLVLSELLPTAAEFNRLLDRDTDPASLLLLLRGRLADLMRPTTPAINRVLSHVSEQMTAWVDPMWDWLHQAGAVSRSVGAFGHEQTSYRVLPGFKGATTSATDCPSDGELFAELQGRG